MEELLFTANYKPFGKDFQLWTINLFVTVNYNPFAKLENVSKMECANFEPFLKK